MNNCLFFGLLLFSQSSFADGIVAEIKENVGENWEDISEWCDEVMALHKLLPTLPRSTVRALMLHGLLLLPSRAQPSRVTTLPILIPSSV